MAISRSLMNRQLRAGGGIMEVTPRENFGIGSKLKKFVRKLIPNEIADVAVKAAPFVAPFNPALAAGMSGLGTFDQTGSIGDSLKSGAMNYAIGQGSRYLGGAGFQGNPFSADGGAFRGGLKGFKSGFSSPLGSDTGLGKFFSNRGTDAVKGVDNRSKLEALKNKANQLDQVGPTYTGMDAIGSGGSEIINLGSTTNSDTFTQKAFELLKKGTKAAFTNKDGSIDKAAVFGAATAAASYAEALYLASQAGLELTEEEYDEAQREEKKAEYAEYLTNFFGAKKDGGRIKYEQGANEYITKRGRQNSMAGLGLLGGLDPTIDESGQKIIVVMTENGPQMMTESEFNEQMGIDNEEEIYKVIDMMNFGNEKKPRIIELGKDMKKDGGRIGFNDGGSVITLMDGTTVQIPDGAYDNGTFKDIIYSSSKGDLLREEIVRKLNFAKGGRVNRRLGSPEKGEGDGLMEMLSVEVDAGGGDDQEDMLMAYTPGFSSQEKSYLFRRIGAAGGSDRSYTMPQLYRILKNPGDYPEDAAVLKEIAVMGLNKKDGGRIGLKNGTGASNRVAQLMLTRSSLLANDPDEDVSFIDLELERDFGIQMKAEGGIMEAKVPTGQMRKNNAGVAERDYRQTGGFVPVGIKERADDVPAMLSKNEFVMTADAVRGIGNGDVEEGSKKLYNTMKQAEQVGKA